MAEQRQIIRAFLASPGDLKAERLIIKEAVDEVNELIANTQGYHIELVGWEHTVSQQGRAQAIINKQLERCELFIGMLWKRWGTPPSNTGPYSSGFEEEFELSLIRNGNTGYPRISLYFKDIPAESLEDKGPEVQKVLNFRKRIEDERLALYETFGESRPIEKRIRKLLAEYIAEKATANNEESIAEQPRSSSDNKDQSTETLAPSSPDILASEILCQVHDATTAATGLGGLTAHQVARFRLLAKAVGTGNNDSEVLGTHDANLLFEQRKTVKFSSRELVTLCRTGFAGYKIQNVPVWYWVTSLASGYVSQLTWSSAFGENAAIKEGALDAMLLTGSPIWTGSNFERSFFIQQWFEDKSTAVRSAALRYLARHGLMEDMPLIEAQLAGSDFGIKAAAIESLIQLHLKYDGSKAIRFALENQFDSISGHTLDALAPYIDILPDSDLSRALNHTNSSLRLRAAQTILNSEVKDASVIEKIKGDAHASVRAEAARYLLDRGDTIGLDDIRRLVVRENKAGGLLGGPSISGEKEYSSLRSDVLKNYSNQELEDLISSPGVNRAHAFFAKCEKHPKAMLASLRENIADRFKAFFEAELEAMSRVWGEAARDLIERTRKLETHYRDDHLERALDIVARINDPQDLNLVRNVIDDGKCLNVPSLVSYIKRHGDRRDIGRLASMVSSPSNPDVVDFRVASKDLSATAEAINSLADGRLMDVLNSAMPPRLLGEIIRSASKKDWDKVPADTIFLLLHNADDGVRKSVCLKLLRDFTKAALSDTLDRYMESDEPRYYNVVHWLDFGTSMPSKVVKGAARYLLEKSEA